MIYEKHLIIDWTIFFSEKEIIDEISHFDNLFLYEKIIIPPLKEKEKILSDFYNMPVNDFRGENEFIIYVIHDKNPIYDYRDTSKGLRLVNYKMFDLKQVLRKKTGGFKVHATDNIQETKNNLLSLGLFDKYYSQKKFKSMRDLFTILNNTIGLEYVVLRNYETINSDNQTIGDIDFLTNDYFLFQRIVDAIEKPKNGNSNGVSNGGTSIRNIIIINNVEIPIDISYINDQYYDAEWQKSILVNSVFHNYIKIPNEKEYFYSLLYHAYLHKKNITNEYKNKLNLLASKISIPYSINTEIHEAIKILENYILNHNYSFTIPIDNSVYFNKKNVPNSFKQSSTTKIKGNLLSETRRQIQGRIYFSDVYAQNNEIIKSATNPICENEYTFLTKLQPSKLFPICNWIKKDKQYSIVSIEKINGFHFIDIYQHHKLWKKKYIYSIIISCIEIVIKLAEHNVSHRDIRPQNIIIKNTNYYACLIDFGWAIDLNNKNAITPQGLGVDFKLREGVFSDAYSMGLCLRKNFHMLNCAKEFYDSLINITNVDYLDKSNLIKELYVLRDNCIEKSKKSLSIKDYIYVLNRRYNIVTKFKKLYNVFTK
ncbi:MAG: hypothetical protein M0R02_13510 [Bacteroidales bacterium]|nr:hypothetical protein [Bacteroidales bacterium]